MEGGKAPVIDDWDVWMSLSEEKRHLWRKRVCTKCIHRHITTNGTCIKECDYILNTGERRICSPMSCKESGRFEKRKRQ